MPDRESSRIRATWCKHRRFTYRSRVRPAEGSLMLLRALITAIFFGQAKREWAYTKKQKKMRNRTGEIIVGKRANSSIFYYASITWNCDPYSRTVPQLRQTKHSPRLPSGERIRVELLRTIWRAQLLTFYRARQLISYCTVVLIGICRAVPEWELTQNESRRVITHSGSELCELAVVWFDPWSEREVKMSCATWHSQLTTRHCSSQF